MGTFRPQPLRRRRRAATQGPVVPEVIFAGQAEVRMSTLDASNAGGGDGEGVGAVEGDSEGVGSGEVEGAVDPLTVSSGTGAVPEADDAGATPRPRPASAAVPPTTARATAAATQARTTGRLLLLRPLREPGAVAGTAAGGGVTRA